MVVHVIGEKKETRVFMMIVYVSRRFVLLNSEVQYGGVSLHRRFLAS